ncbi:MAG: hypothetical protein HUU50_02805 [Candidatus Brocadiae bacterium]|nr:hypothetical protein [Candidatus Brocadiia bacterium]
MKSQIIVLTIFIVMLFLGIQQSYCYPSAQTVVSVTINKGDKTEQVTLYRDHDPNVKVLYMLPTELRIRTYHGKKMFNCVLYRGILNQTVGKKLQESQADKLSGGLVDTILELSGPVENLDDLKEKLAPEYSDYSIAYMPLESGSGGLTISALPAMVDRELPTASTEEKEKIQTHTSGGPVGTEVGSPMPVRLRLSMLDALIMQEALNKPKGEGMTSMLDILYSARYRIALPSDKITITANKKQTYEYTSSHFKSKGGIWFWSFATDIKEISEKLISNGYLKTKIELHGGKLSLEQAQSIAENWVTNFILKELANPPLPLPSRQQAQAEDTKKTWHEGWKWGDLSTSYSKTKISQLIDRTEDFNYEVSTTTTLPIHCKAVFQGLGPNNLTFVDVNNSYFTYTALVVKPFDRAIMKEQQLSNIDVSIRGQAGKDMLRRTVSFDADEYSTYATWMPLKLNFEADKDGILKGQSLDKLEYRINVSGNNGWDLESDWDKFNHSNWEFDMPTIYISNKISYMPVRFKPSLFREYPNLIGLQVVVTPENPDREPVRFSYDTSQTCRYFFYKKSQGTIKKINIIADYKYNRKIITKEQVVNFDKSIVGDGETINEKYIPGILEYGEEQQK